MKKYVYVFEEGSAEMKGLLGGKGANLAEMTRIGLPVPPGFTISTVACNEFSTIGDLPAGLDEQVQEALRALEHKTGKHLGDEKNPLLVSVRSGAAVSMPGMMDTVLNLGLNDKTVLAHAAATKNPRFAWDCYRRFVQMFANVVLSLPMHEFERVFVAHKARCGAQSDPEIPAEVLQQVVADFQALVLKFSGSPFPQDPQAQLQASMRAVFESWSNPRAVVYRKVHKIPDSLGTAVNVQAMAFGNMGDDCATGVAFTRNPNSGEKEFYGEYLLNAQGEDVVAGIRTPHQIAQLRSELAEAYDQLYHTCELLESHYGDMQDIEFTIERGRLFMLQCRTGKRTAEAALRIAVDMVAEGKIDKEQALLRVDPAQIETLLHRRIDPKASLDVIATGLPASPGAASGQVVFDPDEAERLHEKGIKVVLLRHETTPDDIHGMIAAEGVVTTRGGMTCHAAIVARGMGKPCIVGCDAIRLDEEAGVFRVGDREVKQGELVSLDGGTGRVIIGAVPLVDAVLSDSFQTLLGWADERRRLRVRANADNPRDAQKAREFGAEGIGLCRTEHMFGQGGHHPERMAVVQEMILADTLEDRMVALARLQPMQEEDFTGILRAMSPFPVTIRLLDPPLHEFLPGHEELAVQVAVAKATGQDATEAQVLLRKVRALSESNPMLGFRGVRLGVVYPEIYEMQVRALFAAAQKLADEGVVVKPEVMIPLVGHVNELKRMKVLIDRVHEELKPTFAYQVGTMIEVPRAALVADEIAEFAEFFSFGTNDLTQTTFGYSRDDAEGRFLGHYLQDKVLLENPFVTLDRKGVGKLVQMAAELGRKTRPDIKLGICGEHGGEPASIEFCHEVGLSYVSCSPFRVPVARLAAAQAQVREMGVRATASAV
jgi:pyruvate,orthophosphate dikinase